jgi:hypothetical protein
VFLGWNRKNNGRIPVYSIALPPMTGTARCLILSLAVTGEEAKEPGKKATEQNEPKEKDESTKPNDEPTDFTVELETVQGASHALPLGQFGTLMPPFRVRFTKFALLDDFAYQKPAEPIFQTFELPLKAFGIDDPGQLRTIRLRFDKTITRVLILSRIGLEQ